MTNRKGYVDADYLQTSSRLSERWKSRSHSFMHIKPGNTVADIGCGPASDTLTLAKLVGPEGHVFGIDLDTDMVAQASEKAMAAGVDHYVTHRQGNATQLPLEDNILHSCRSERMFQHLEKPEAVLSEMVRVTLPGGWVVVSDADWGTFSIYSDEVDIERKLVKVAAEHLVHNGYAGRRLYSYFQRQGLVDLAVDMMSLPFTSYALAEQVFVLPRLESIALNEGIVTPEEIARWRRNLRYLDEQGGFFASIANVLVAGRVPAS